MGNAKGNGQNITLHLQFKIKQASAMLFIYQRPFLLTTGISSELSVMRLHTSRPHRTCMWPQLGQLDHFKGMIDTKGGGLSLPLGSRPRTATRPGPFLLLHRSHLGPHKEEREKKRSYGFSSRSSHIVSWQPLHFLVQRAKQFPFCCNMLEFTNK